ncbi:MAG: hypothetical protein ACKOXB_03970 [Flavobacteriales bacterium]
MKKAWVILVLLTMIMGFESCTSNKYCVGGKKKYHRMKKDTTMMVF